MPHYGEAKPGEGVYSQEHSNPHYKTHEELVAAYRAHIRVTEARLTLREPVPPWVWIRRDLYTKWENSPYRSEKQRFFRTLRIAWDVLIYDRFLEPGSATENTAGINISDAYKEDPTIRLNDAQVSLIDALAEVAGIPHPRRQNQILIPQKFADLDQLRSSPQYQRRAAAYEAHIARSAAAQRRRRR